MKKLFFIVSLCLCSVTFAQEKDVTKFLGIPVDGSKAEMIRKLREKGYQIDPNNPNLVETISKEEIEELFESRDFAYLGRKNKEIPGINLGSRENYVR